MSLYTSDGMSPKKLIPGQSRALNINLKPKPDPRPFIKGRSQAFTGLYFLLHKSPNFLGPSQKIDPEPVSILGPSQNFDPDP